MLVLAFDTSTSFTEIGIGEVGSTHGPYANIRGGVSGSFAAPHGVAANRHVEFLVPHIADYLADDDFPGGALAPTDVEAVVVGLGPGPYTGLRIGIATAAAFGDALGIPVYGVSSLDALASDAYFNVVERGCAPFERDDMLVVSDARRKELYWARYHKGQRVGEFGVCRPAELSGLLGDFRPTVVAGDGALLADTDLSRVRVVYPALDRPGFSGLVRAAAPALLAGQPPGPLSPLYLRPPDAQPPKGIAQPPKGLAG